MFYSAIDGLVMMHLMVLILEKGAGASRGMNRIGWRYRLIPARCGAVPGWCRDDGLLCAATRRHTLRTGADSGSVNLEKSGCFIVMIPNHGRVFQCTVNWARARLRTALIAVGAAGSSRKWTGGEFEVVSQL